MNSPTAYGWLMLAGILVSIALWSRIVVGVAAGILACRGAGLPARWRPRHAHGSALEILHVSEHWRRFTGRLEAALHVRQDA